MTDPVDPTGFIASWASSVRLDPVTRVGAADDRAFWVDYAARYDEAVGGVASAAVTIERLRSLVWPTDALLEVGAGTGRMCLSLAADVARVTALDHSPHMLAVLQQKADAAGLTAVQTVEAELTPASDLAVHDVVIAPWSLYRCTDLVGTLEVLASAARRVLAVVCGTGARPPHRAPIEAICGSWTDTTMPDHLVVAAALWELGCLADVSVLVEHHRVEAATPAGIVDLLAPVGSPPDRMAALEHELSPWFRREGDRWSYEWPHEVGVVTVDLPATLRRG